MSEFIIVEETENLTPKRDKPEPMPEDFGRNLDTLEKARLWLTNPHNWHKSELYILKWNGLLPTVSESHGRRLTVETWDDGLPWCVVTKQRDIRAGRVASGSIDPSGMPENSSVEENG